MSRRPQSLEHYKTELLYCELIDPQNPGKQFNNDPECFKRYVHMQADLARADGFSALAAEIDGVTQ